MLSEKRKFVRGSDFTLEGLEFCHVAQDSSIMFFE